MSELANLRTSVLDIAPDATPEQIVDVLGRVEIALKALKEIKALAEERILERIRETGAFEIGGIRYWEGTKRTVKCVDLLGTADALLSAGAGDLESFIGALTSQPFKQATVKTMIGEDRWTQLFEVREEADLETGRPKKELCVVNTKFLPERKSA